MPICLGILWERCGIIYFLSRSGKSPAIEYNRKDGDLKLICAPPCNAVNYFHKKMLKPYSVPAEAIKAGYSPRTKYRPIPVDRTEGMRP